MLKVSVISPERVVFEGDAASVIAPAFDGSLGILTGHAPMVTLLGEGELRVEGEATFGAHRFTVAGGFLQVADDHVRIVTERAETA